tara:strand:- start:9344 stop:10252 length:909 start_codon:yes stop_codon:yes gene_type:complete
MSTNAIEIYIICKDIKLFDWLRASLLLTNLNPIIIKRISIADLSEVSEKSQTDNLLIAEEMYCDDILKSIYFNFNHQLNEFPILILTESFNEPQINNISNSTIDTLTKHSLTILLLQHAIQSITRDFQLTQKLKKLALFDALTGAANRYLFEDRLNQAIKQTKRHCEGFSILYFDLDDFKQVNDSYGHATGDLLLKEFVSVIKQALRETDTIARLGGDEFSMILVQVNQQTLDIIISKIKDLFNDMFTLGGHIIPIQFSIGGVCIVDHSLCQLNAEELLKIADSAVYEAKKINGTSSVIKYL